MHLIGTLGKTFHPLYRRNVGKTQHNAVTAICFDWFITTLLILFYSFMYPGVEHSYYSSWPSRYFEKQKVEVALVIRGIAYCGTQRTD
jgi:hypothetical protein